MNENDAEYQALERVITADKRYRKFLYLLTVVGFAILLVGGWLFSNWTVEKQKAAVAKVAQENSRYQSTVARESIRYITCIIVIPIDQRTTDVQQRCFDAADLPGGLNRKDFSPVVIPDSKSASAGRSAATDQSASAPASLEIASSLSNTNPASTSSQPNNSQPTVQQTTPSPSLPMTVLPFPTIPCITVGSAKIC